MVLMVFLLYIPMIAKNFSKEFIFFCIAVLYLQALRLSDSVLKIKFQQKKCQTNRRQ